MEKNIQKNIKIPVSFRDKYLICFSFCPALWDLNYSKEKHVSF